MLHKREGESAAMFFIRWTGRLLSLATGLLLALFFFGEGLHFSELTALELLGLLFFPFGLWIGFAVGWHNELAGGGISVVSLAAFYLIYGMAANGSLPSGFSFALFTVPGLLFLAYGLIDRLALHHHRSGRVTF